MTHSSGDFNPGAAYNELANPTIIEFVDQPGIATELATSIDDATTRWADQANDEGWIQLSTFEGGSVDVRRSELTDNKLSAGKVASGGLRKWLRGRFSATTDSLHYDVRLPEEDGDTTLSLIKLTGSTGSTHASGKQTVTIGGVSTSAELYTGLNLEETVQRATGLIVNGFPLSAEAATAARQAGPCETITGNEAVAVQKVIEPFLANSNAADLLGDKTGEQKLMTYEAVEPRLTGQWSINRLTTILRAGTVMPNVAGAEGRSVLTFLNFSSETFNTVDGEPITDPLVVCIEGVYEPGTERLAAAEVQYYTEGRAGRKQMLAVSPEGRQDIHAAIASQVNPLYFV